MNTDLKKLANVVRNEDPQDGQSVVIEWVGDSLGMKVDLQRKHLGTLWKFFIARMVATMVTVLSKVLPLRSPRCLYLQC